MKSWNHLFQKVIDRDNLLAAMHEAAKDKGDYRSVKIAMQDTKGYVSILREKLINKTWKPPHHIPEMIMDGPSKKIRKIIKPSYEEQVVHHAVIQVLKPIFTHGMYEYTCGSVPGRGPSYGRKHLKRYIEKHPENCRYCFKGDVKHFFHEIVHEKLLAMLSRIIKDDDMMWLLTVIITCEPDSPGRGIPIGFYTSQWFSNFYLQGFDHYVKEQLRIKCYFRYADDIVMLSASKRQLHLARVSIERYFHTIGLRLKENWQVFRFHRRGSYGKDQYRFIDFMGFKFYCDRVTLRKRTFIKAIRKARKMKQPNWYSATQMISYLGSMKRLDCHDAFVNYIKPYIKPKKLKKLVSQHDRKRNKFHGGEILCPKLTT